MKKILGVVRASTVRQETESQQYELEQYIISLGFKKSEIEWLVYAGASARKMNAAYLEMMDRIKSTISNSETIKTVAAWHLNRLGRREKPLIDLKEWFEENNVQVYVKENSLKLFNDDGTVNEGADITWSLYANLIKNETKEMFAKFARARARNKREGKWTGGPNGVMFGYTVDENNYIVPNPDEVKIVKRIFEDYATGKYSFVDLTEEYNALGIVGRNGTPLAPTFLKKIVGYESYTGGTNKYGVIYQRIIEPELFAKCKAIRESKHVTPYRDNAWKNINILTGILKCSKCGSNYCDTGHSYACYKSRKAYYITYGDRCTESSAIDKEIMNKLAWEVAQGAYYHKLQNTDEKQLVNDLEKQKLMVIQKIKTAEENIAKVEVKKNKAVDTYIDGIITKDRMKEKVVILDKEMNELKASLKIYYHDIKTIDRRIEELNNEDLPDKLRRFLQEGKNATDKEKKSIIAETIESITLESKEMENLPYTVGTVGKFNERSVIKKFAPVRLIRFNMKNKRFNRTYLFFYRSKQVNNRLFYIDDERPDFIRKYEYSTKDYTLNGVIPYHPEMIRQLKEVDNKFNVFHLSIPID